MADAKADAKSDADSFQTSPDLTILDFINTATDIKVTAASPANIEVTKDGKTLTFKEPVDGSNDDIVTGPYGDITSEGKTKTDQGLGEYASEKFAEVRRAVLTRDKVKDLGDADYAAAVVVLTKILKKVKP